MWIIATVFAASCQSLRTALQNSLAQQEGLLYATMVRSLYGLPLVFLYLVIVWFVLGAITINSHQFWFAVIICALAQMLATYWMLKVFRSGSYMLGILLAKTEAVLTALVAIPFLGSYLNGLAWLGVVTGVLGALTMSLNLQKLRHAYRDVSLLFGLGSGLCFALTSVAASFASRSIEGPVLVSAGVTLCFVLVLQAVILTVLVVLDRKDLSAPFKYQPLLSIRVGLLSALGSIGWFVGFALVNPALVKTLGQIEILGTLYFSKRRFNETISFQQGLGGSMILLSVVVVTLSRYGW